MKLANAIEDQTYKISLDKCIMFLSKLEETWIQMVHHISENKNQFKDMFDKKPKNKDFKVGDLAILWDKRREPKSMHGKFDSLWMGPFPIH